jgi:SNF2 family DNA or RNA helicase
MKPDLLEKLQKIRLDPEVKLKPCAYLKDTIKGSDGQEKPLGLRNYQKQMVCHLLAVQRFVIGDDMGLGKSYTALASFAYLYQAGQASNILILTKKSVVLQWADEFDKFTIGVNVFACRGTPKERSKTLAAYLAADGPKALIMGYRTATQDFSDLQNIEWDVIAMDEATVFKNPLAQVHQVCKHLSYMAKRVCGG